MFNFKLTKNGVLVKDFMPCRRESDNMVGLYDLVSDTFFENKSTEELFIEGAEVPKGERIRLATIEDVSAAGVDVTSDQEIDGVKTFVKTPLVKTGSVAIPEEYQPVEYVESTGTQYIDTGIVGKTGVSSYCKIMITGDLAANAALLASRIDGGDTRYYIGCRYYNGTINFGHAEEFMSTTAPQQNVIKEYEYITKNNTLTIKENGVAIFVKNITNSFDTGKNLYLFANNYAGVASNFISCKLYALKIYDNETLVRNFIPCYRKADNAAGVYDAVSETFFTDLSGTNLGVGAATDPIGETVKLATVNDIPSDYVDLESEQTIVGKKIFNERPVVLYGGTKIPEEYQEVEYIESNGTQYINTGLVIPTTAQSVEYQGKLQFLSESNVNTSVWGSLNRSLYKSSLNLLIYNKKIGITYPVNKGFDFLWPSGSVANQDTAIKTINVSATQTKLTASIDTYTASVGLAQGLGCDYPIGMFGCNDNNKESPATIPMRLHGDFKIWIDSRLAAWYVPCRRIDDGVLGLYDVVSAKFLTSTVAFVACGDDVQNSLLNDKVATLSDIKDQVDTTSDQEIVGVKNFKNGFQINGLKVEKDSSDRIAFYFGSNPKVKIGQLDTLFANRVTPDASNTYDLGRSGVYWRDLYLSGGLSDGTNKISIATIAGFANKPNKDEVVDLESDQEVNGTKTFISRPLVKTLVSKLPDAYQEVEYIESTGTQYIDTGYKLNTDCAIEFDYYLTSGESFSPFGSFDGETTTGFTLYTKDNHSRFGYFEIGSGIGVTGNYNGYISNQRTTAIYSKNGVYQNSNLVYSITTKYVASNFNCFLFCRNVGGVATGLGAIRFYIFKIYDNDTLVRNFVPCYRKSDSVIGMYDTVSGNFLTNAGSGTFLKGSDVITSLTDKATPVAAMSDIPDAYTKTESDSRYITYDGDSTLKGGLVIGKGGLTLGTTNGNGLLFPSSVISEGAQCSIGVYNPMDANNYCTLVGFINGAFTIGHGSFNTNIRGKNTRPTYNGNELALKSDVGSTDSCVDTTSNQEIDGIKTFNSRPLIKVAGTKIPEEYQEVEYIESTGTQYIDTGIVTNNNSKIVIQAQATEAIGMGYRLFGSRTGSKVGNFISTNNDKVYVDYGGSSFEASFALDNNIHTYNLDKNKFYYDGVLLKEWNVVEFSAPSNAYLFGAYHDGGIVVKPWKI